jgi:hypothetical protein
MVLLRPAVFAAVLALSCLNRETGLFLVVIYAAFTWHDRAARLRSLLYLVVGVSVVVLVRLLVGPGERFWTLDRVITTNIATLPEAFITVAVTFGVAWLLAWRGAWSSDARPFVIALIIYLLPVFIFGLWRETRLLLPVFPAILWLAGCGLTRDRGRL